MQSSFAIAAFGAPLACAVIYLGFDDLPLGFLFGIALYFLSIVFCVWSVFRYKPIYDRWVKQHGIGSLSTHERRFLERVSKQKQD